MGGLCSKDPEPEPLPPVVVDAKCVTGAQVSADGLRVTGDPSGVFVGIAMSKIFGNDKGYFEVRLAKLSDGSKVLTGLGGRQSERSGGLFHLPDSFDEMINVGAQLRVAELQANDVVTRLFPTARP